MRSPAEFYVTAFLNIASPKRLDRDIEYIERCGVEIRCSTALGKNVTLDNLRDQGYEAVFIAAGLTAGQSSESRRKIPPEFSRVSTF